MRILILLNGPHTDGHVLGHVSGLLPGRPGTTELHLVRVPGAEAKGTTLKELTARHFPRHAVKTAVLDGCVASELIDHVRREPVDLVVMAENADSNLDEMLLFAGVGPVYKVKPTPGHTLRDYSGLAAMRS